MLIFCAQVYENMPVPYQELFADYGEMDGVGFWYEEAVKIDKQRAAAQKKH